MKEIQEVIFGACPTLNMIQCIIECCAACLFGLYNDIILFIIVNHIVNEITGSVSENNITASWSKPNGSGVCCEQYRVVTSEGDVININTTSYTLQNITKQEQREYAFISVRCLDKLGTEGPPFVYRPNISKFFCELE